MQNDCKSFDLSMLPERHISGWNIFGVSQLKEKQIAEDLDADYTKVRIIARKLYMALVEKINDMISKSDKNDIFSHYNDTKNEWGQGYSIPVTYIEEPEISDLGVSFDVSFDYLEKDYGFEVWLLNKKSQRIINGLAGYSKEDRCIILPILEEGNAITRNTVRFIYQHEGLIIHELTHNIDFINGVMEEEEYYNQKQEVNKPSEVNALTQQIIWYIHKQILQSKNKYPTLKDFAKAAVSEDFIKEVFGVQFSCSINSPNYNEELKAVDGIWQMLNDENKNKIKHTVKEYLMDYISKIKRENVSNNEFNNMLLDESVFKLELIKE